jgi:hypothetical protein
MVPDFEFFMFPKYAFLGLVTNGGYFWMGGIGDIGIPTVVVCPILPLLYNGVILRDIL